jgi:hypothetical protein
LAGAFSVEDNLVFETSVVSKLVDFRTVNCLLLCMFDFPLFIFFSILATLWNKVHPELHPAYFS